MITYRKTSNAARIKTFLRLALREHLYVDNWSFNRLFHAWLLDPPVVMKREVETVVLAFAEDRPIGICVLYKKNQKDVVSFFVKSQFRRQQVATTMFSKLRLRDRPIHFLLGMEYSKKLFLKLGAHRVSHFEYKR